MEKSNTNDLQPRKRQLWATLFRRYVSFINSKIYFRKVHTIGQERLPQDGTPIVLVSNHQNCLNDPLTLALKVKDRRPNFLARANVFAVHPVVDKLLRSLGLLPAYRVKFEGFAAVNKNKGTLNEVSSALGRGETVILYPECGHQNKRWLGTFSQAYLKMAFGAAEESNFQRDVVVMPTANHYSQYFHAREDMLITFGTPISIAPYYDLYKEHPRRAMRLVNQLVREQIENLMLNISDLENYESIDFLRESSWTDKWAKENGLEPNHLPDKLKADKELVSHLENASLAAPEEIKRLFEKTRQLIAGIKELGIREWLFAGDYSRAKQVVDTLLLAIGLPLFLVCIVPTALMFIVPALLIKRFIKDEMFFSSVNVGATALITYPICCIIPSVVMIFTQGWLTALIYFFAFPLMFIYAWNYVRWCYKVAGGYRYLLPRNRQKVEQMRALRIAIFAKLDEIMRKAEEYEAMANRVRAQQKAAKEAAENAAAQTISDPTADNLATE